MTLMEGGEKKGGRTSLTFGVRKRNVGKSDAGGEDF